MNTRVVTLDVDSSADESDASLVNAAVNGSKQALQELVSRHQPFVFNLAMKLFGHRENAEDLCQEVLIKAITKLHLFRGESAFRTWLYRIAVNHFLKTRRCGMERHSTDFATYFDTIDQVPDETGEDMQIGDDTVEELRLRCTQGMLMCLERPQRLVFVLGAMLRVPDQLAATLLDITPANFRVRLHRARSDLYNWMNQRCGLINTSNPCRCAKKTRRYIRSGTIDPDNLQFNSAFSLRMQDIAAAHADGLVNAMEQMHEQIYLSHPFQTCHSLLLDEIMRPDRFGVLFESDSATE